MQVETFLWHNYKKYFFGVAVTCTKNIIVKSVSELNVDWLARIFRLFPYYLLDFDDDFFDECQTFPWDITLYLGQPMQEPCGSTWKTAKCSLNCPVCSLLQYTGNKSSVTLKWQKSHSNILAMQFGPAPFKNINMKIQKIPKCLTELKERYLVSVKPIIKAIFLSLIYFM